MEDCLICVESFSKTIRKKITCSCGESACMTCYKKHFLNSTEEARCMYCKKSFSLKFLFENFPTTFIWSNNPDSYRIHRENMLLDQQLAMMPETQKIVSDRLKRNRLNNLRFLINRISREISSLKDIPNIIEVPEIIKDNVKNICEFLNVDIELKKKEKRELEQELEQEPEKIKSFATRGCCPIKDCRGFIEEKWSCGICSTKICQECMEPKEKNHECNQNIVENVKNIRSTTKPCPICRSPIFKIDGCYQMLCTKPGCGTFIDWKTGLEIKKVLHPHNPHYAEFLRNNPNHGANNCNAIPEYRVRTIDKITEEQKDNLYRVIRFVNEVRDLSTADYENRYREECQSLRIQYLEKIIDKNELKNLIQQLHKKFSKNSEIREIRQMFSETCIDLIRTFFYNKQSYKELIQQIKKIENFATEALEEIGKLYKNTTPTLNNWNTLPNLL